MRGTATMTGRFGLEQFARCEIRDGRRACVQQHAQQVIGPRRSTGDGIDEAAENIAHWPLVVRDAAINVPYARSEDCREVAQAANPWIRHGQVRIVDHEPVPEDVREHGDGDTRDEQKNAPQDWRRRRGAQRLVGAPLSVSCALFTDSRPSRSPFPPPREHRS